MNVLRDFSFHFRLNAAKTLIFVFALMCWQAHADLYFHSWTNHSTEYRRLVLNPELSYYSSQSNFDETGTAFQPVSLTSYHRILADVWGTYGLLEDWSFFVRVGWADVRTASPGGTLGNTYGFGDQALGLNLRAFKSEGGVEIHPQLQVEFPAYVNTHARTNQTPFLGDGSVDALAGGFVLLPLQQGKAHTWNITGGGAYEWRNKTFSSGLPWSLILQYLPTQNGITLAGGVTGLVSLKTDASPYVHQSLVYSGAFGSYAAGAINPSIFNIDAELGYQVADAQSFYLRFQDALAGTNAPQGWMISAGLKWRLSDRENNLPERLSPRTYGKSNQGFVNYSLEAKVTQVNDKLNLIKIDKGTADLIKTGQTMDVFKPESDGSPGEAIARAKVISVKEGEAVLTIGEYFKEVWIEEGFIVKKPIE